MAKYQKKQHLTEVEADRFEPGLELDGVPALETLPEASGDMWCPTKHGGVRVKEGDWVVSTLVGKKTVKDEDGDDVEVNEYERVVMSHVDFCKTFDTGEDPEEAPKPKRSRKSKTADE